MRGFFLWRFLIGALFFGAAASPGWSGDALAPGPAFSDPSFRVVMPDEWVVRPIHRGDVDLQVSMDQQMFRILGPAIHRWARNNKLKIGLRDGTCGHAASALSNKRADIGGFCCPPRNTDRLPGLRFYTLGITAVALLAHPDNPVSALTAQQARELFSGEIRRWSKVISGSAGKRFNKPVLPVARLHCKPRPGHWRLILSHEDQFSSELQEVGAIPDMISVVASNPRAIGHAAYWFAVDHYSPKGKVKALKVDGVSPADVSALARGDYPFYKTFSVTLWEGSPAQNAAAKKLVDYLLREVEKVDASFGVVSPSRLKRAGWRFKGGELVGGPPG